jgi:molybdate transport system substrate-binding protein
MVSMQGILSGISSMATRHILADLSAAYEQTSGWCVKMDSAGGLVAAQRVREAQQTGEAFDVVVLASEAIDKLIASGHLDPSSQIDLMRSGISVAVNERASRPDISSGNAVKAAVLAAASISYSTGPSGQYLESLFERWGIGEQVQAKLIVPPPGQPVGALIARGEAALGFQQRSELIDVKGITLLGDLPPDIAHVTTFSAAATKSTAQREAVMALLQFMNSPEAEHAKLIHGMSAI